MFTIIVDSRNRDPKSEQVVKYTNLRGEPTQYKSIRKISPEKEKLSELGIFLCEKLNGSYIGGFLHKENDVIIEGPEGSDPNAGNPKYGSLCPPSARLKCKGYLWPVFEPNDDETKYINKAARKMIEMAKPGGRVIIKKEIFDIL
jgi:hypothetical protein